MAQIIITLCDIPGEDFMGAINWTMTMDPPKLEGEIPTAAQRVGIQIRDAFRAVPMEFQEQK